MESHYTISNIPWWILLLITPGFLYSALMVWAAVSYRKRISLPNSSFLPVSIVVAARNEEANLPALLKVLLPQLTDQSEIIIVDDHSTDNTATVVERFADSRIKLIKAPPTMGISPKQEALSAGIAEANNDIILLTDADCRPGPHWVSALTGTLNTGYNYVAGDVLLTGRGLSGNFQMFEQTVLMALAAWGFEIKHPFLCSGASIGFTRKLWDEAGGFEGSRSPSGDDVLLLQKVRTDPGPSRMAFVASEGSRVVTEAPDKWLKMLAQRVRWAAKNRIYKDGLSMFIGFFIVLVSFTMLCSVVIPFFSGKFIAFTLLIWILKILTDLTLYFTVASLRKPLPSVWIVLLGQPLFVVYGVIVPLLSLRGTYTWKGRRFKDVG